VSSLSVTSRSTREWQELDHAHQVHPFTDQKQLRGRGVRVITRAQGVYIWDSEGNKILDGMAGLWCVNVGYGRKELAQAALRQMEELPFYNNFFQTATVPQIELAHLLSRLTPNGLSHFIYSSSGSEANDTVIRLVRHYWATLGKPGKRIFIGRTQAYHGSTLAAVSMGGMPNMQGMDRILLPEFERIVHPHAYWQGEGVTKESFGLKAAQALEQKILQIGAQNVAAFIAEPAQGAGGVFDPPANYWPEIQRICKKYDVLLVADEVICGFGRTGNWFGSHTYDIAPDLMSMAKGLSSGYLPLSAVAMTDRIFDVIADGGPIAHGFTYSGHPAACAVAIENIGILQREHIIEHVREVAGPYFSQKLNELAASHPIVGEVRGVGLMAAIQLVRDKRKRVPLLAQEEPAIKCREECLRNNLIIRAVDQAMVLSPPLVITRSEIDELIGKVSIGLDVTARQLGVS
jgi:putrescine---pyruvate transaminase